MNFMTKKKWTPTLYRNHCGLKVTLEGGPYNSERTFALDINLCFPENKDEWLHKQNNPLLHFYQGQGDVREDGSETFKYKGLVTWPEMKPVE